MVIKLPVIKGNVKRVKNPLPVPVVCNLCGGNVALVSHKEIYHGKEYGSWPYAYLCAGCGAYVGLHPGTEIPLGTLADAELRKWRKNAKIPFEWWRKSFGIHRSDAYRLLAGKMGIDVANCHFGWFDIEQCQTAYNVVHQIIRSSKK